MTQTAATVGSNTYKNNYAYTHDLLTQVKHNTSAAASGDVVYNLAYDALERPTTVKVGNQTLSTTNYNTNGTVHQVDYGNGDYIQYQYDAYKRLTGVRARWDYEDRYAYVYGANGEVAQLTDTETSTVTTSEYDAANRPMRLSHKHLDTGDHQYTGTLTYDQYNNLANFKEQVGTGFTAYNTAFTYDNENRPTNLNFGSSRQVAYTYDGLGRITQRTLNAGNAALASNYTYVAGGFGTNSTSPLVQSITQLGSTLTYAYDSTGNITSVSNGTKTITYVYDLLGQLIRANDPLDTTAGTNGTTWVYSYDLGGNILSKTAYAYTTGTVGTAVQTNTYTYGDANWKDKLTAYNGTAITYDAIGNPLSDGTWNHTWVYGRRMRSSYKGEFGEPGYDEITYEYNADGVRTRKTRMYYDANVSGGIAYQNTAYMVHGSNLVHMIQGNDNLHFFYDAQNSPAVVEYNGVSYGYVKNLQGDIIAIVNASGTKVVEYVYDAWGKLLSKTGTMASTLGTLNPFRYRGYVYDEETGLYYLNNRYYNPNLCRFINADNEILFDESLCDAKLFTYCANNPVRYEDRTGNGFWDALKKVAEAALIVAAVAVVAAVVIGTGGGAGFALAGGGVLSNAAAATALVSAANTVGAAGATALGVANAGLLFSKTTSKSGKEKASDKPSWANKSGVDPNLSAQQNATKMLNEKYGIGNWRKGPGTEFNQIVKWIQRSLFNK